MTDLSGPDREYVVDQHLRITVLTRGVETDGRHDLVRAVAGPGMATALHKHSRYEERLFVLEGELIIWAGAEKVTVGAGGFYVIRMNVPHMIQTGPAGASTLNISSPAAFAELIERTATPAHLAKPDVELDLELFMKVTTELGDVVLGPPGTTPAELDKSGSSGSERRGAMSGIHAVSQASGDRPARG
ncbi:MAG: cupin domain-containing protein [Pseudonocardiaceae bacterium]